MGDLLGRPRERVSYLAYPNLFGTKSLEKKKKKKKDSSNSPVAYFYFDPYSRTSEKCGGAWMNVVFFSRSCMLARNGSSVRLLVMVCNQMPRVGDKPSLMTFREVAMQPDTTVTSGLKYYQLMHSQPSKMLV